MKHKTIYADLLVSMDTYPIDKVFLVGDGAQGGQEPAVAIKALPNIICGGTFLEENRIIENVLRSVSH